MVLRKKWPRYGDGEGESTVTRNRAWAWLVCVVLGSAAAAEAAWLAPSKDVQKRRVDSAALMRVDVDVNALFAQRTGETQVIEVNGGRTLALTGLRVLEGFDGARTWVGLHRDGESEHNVFVTEYRGTIYGTLYASDTTYDVIGDTQKSNVVLRDQKAAGFTLAPPTTNDYVVPSLPVAAAFPDVQKAANGGDITTLATPAPQSVIDLLIVYTEGMVTRFGSESGVLARLNNLVAQSNTAYLNSEVAITLRLVATLRTSYSETTTDGAALNDITPSIPAFNRVVATPVTLQGVAPLRDSSQADIVMLVRPFRRNAHEACGMANRNGTVGFGMEAYEGWAYGVFSEGLDLETGNGTCPDTAFSHEMGHVMGMNHDRGSLAVDAPNATVPPVSYGFGFGYGYNAPGCPNGYCYMPTHGDIMSIAYVNRNLPCYSHPGIRISPDGQSCGLNLTTGSVAGIAPDTPDEACASTAAGCGPAAASCANTPNCAYSARALNYVRVKVSRWRDAAVTGTLTQGATPINSFSLCTSSPNILCTTTNNIYRCSGPAGWTGSIHPRAAGYRIAAAVVSAPLAAATTTNNLSAQLDSAFPNCNLDVDGNGILDASTDGVAMLRRYLGVGSSAYGGLVGVCAQNTTAAALYAASVQAAGAVTGNNPPTFTSDGLVTLRAMMGLKGAAVTNGAVAAGAPRGQWNTPAGANNNIREWLNANCGTAFTP